MPAALFGACMADSFVHQYDATHRPHLSQQSYRDTIERWEVVGLIIGGAPGLLLLGWYQFRRRREDEREAATTQGAADDADETVWPPPPCA